MSVAKHPCGREGQPITVYTNSFEILHLPTKNILCMMVRSPWCSLFSDLTDPHVIISSWQVWSLNSIHLNANDLIVIEPELRNHKHANEIIDRLQNHMDPNIFTPKAVCNGKAILFACHRLCLFRGASLSEQSKILTSCFEVHCGHVG
jgi:hypothetical protein